MYACHFSSIIIKLEWKSRVFQFGSAIPNFILPSSYLLIQLLFRSYVVHGSFSDVHFWVGPYIGERSVFRTVAVQSHTNGERRTTGTGHGHHKKGAL
jgi:hypothetical protein